MRARLSRGQSRGRAALGGLLAATLLFTACSSAESDDSADDKPAGPVSDVVPQPFRDDGKVTIATAVGNPPYASIEEGSSEPVGFDMDLVKAVTEELGLTPEIEVVQFPTIVPGLASGRFDLAISSLTITPERTATLDMLAYMQIGTGLLVAAGNPDGIESITDLCGLKVGVSKGSSNQIPLEAAQADCTGDPIEIVETEGNDFVALQSARVDAMALDAAGSFAAADANSEAFEAVGGEVYAAGVAGIGFDQSNGDLAEAYQTALESLIADGTYDELLADWGLEELGYTETAINPEVPAAG
jgi:polar amino acid transport system substrate-binding protein